MSADLTEAVEAAARALYEAQRAEILADDPMISIVGVPWERAPAIVQHEWREGMLPVLAAAAPSIEAQVRAQVEAQVRTRVEAEELRLQAMFKVVGDYGRDLIALRRPTETLIGTALVHAAEFVRGTP